MINTILRSTTQGIRCIFSTRACCFGVLKSSPPPPHDHPELPNHSDTTRMFSTPASEQQVLTSKKTKQEKTQNTIYNKVTIGVGAAVAATLAAFGATKVTKCGEIKQTENVSEDSEIKPDKLHKRVSVMQIAANNPIEDRFNAVQLHNASGFYSAVFDGHGGWQLAEFAKKELHLDLDQILMEEKDIGKAIKIAFDRVEQKFLDICRSSFKLGFSKAGYVGACALVAVVSGNKIYCGNAGDCKAVVLSKLVDDQGEIHYKAKRLSKSFSANKESEQKRLKEQFPLEADIVKCRSPKACYVKGKLMPTRALGDYRLKHADFNFHDFSVDQGYRQPITQYTGPYITHEPDLIVHDIRPEDEFVVMASDGLWDELTKQDIANALLEQVKKESGKSVKERLSEQLMERSLQHAAKDNNLTKEQMLQISLGKRRNFHDDITILVIDLRNQYKPL